MPLSHADMKDRMIESVAPGSRTAVMLAVAPHDAPQATVGYGNTGSVGCLVPAGTDPSSAL